MPDAENIESLTTQASGSMGVTTFSHNQHGPYRRARTTPADPNTALQQAVRAAMAQCVTAWNATLTRPKREAWERYALAVLLSSPLGRRTHVGGIGMYVRTNVPRLQAAEGTLPRVDVAPALLNLPGFTPITRVVLNVVDDTIHPFFTDSDDWATESGAAMLFYASAPQSLQVNFWRGPYRYAAPLLGSDFRLSSPATVALPQPAVLGDRVFVRARITRADGRLSHDFRLPADTVTQVAPLPISAVFTPGSPPFALAAVTFDALLRVEAHDTTNWTVRYANSRWTVRNAITLRDSIRLVLQNVAIQIGPDIIDYSPPAFDVNGLLTGIPVVAFQIPLI